MESKMLMALKAKGIAERKFEVKDIAGAKRFACMARELFPLLEGISQIIAALDVYLAAEVKVDGESDWYKILNLNASADKKTLRIHYEDLFEKLHPSKNKLKVAEGAFKLIWEAWNVLSDKRRKMEYDQKRNANAGSQQYQGGSSLENRKKSPKPTADPSPSGPSNLNTFWTECYNCKIQYEYSRIYLNKNLLCPNCYQPFLAEEKEESAIPENARPWPVIQRQENACNGFHIDNGYESCNSSSVVNPEQYD